MDEIMSKAERVTDTLTVFQQKGVFSYGTDAVLLAEYVEKLSVGIHAKIMCDLGSGTGIIPLYLCDRHQGLRAELVEINRKAVELSVKSAKASGLDNRVHTHLLDLKQVKSAFPQESFDFVTCNPPYMLADGGKMCRDDDITLARHEIACTVSDVFEAAFHLLRTGGCIYLVYRTDRLSALMEAARKNRFEIKDMQFVRLKKTSTDCDLVLCQAKKNAKQGMHVRCVDL